MTCMFVLFVIQCNVTSDEQFSVLACPELHSKTVLGQLLGLDAIRLCAQLTVMVTDDTQYKRLVDQRGPPAQALLNLLQAVCDS
jgi:hypothetical protein